MFTIYENEVTGFCDVVNAFGMIEDVFYIFGEALEYVAVNSIA